MCSIQDCTDSTPCGHSGPEILLFGMPQLGKRHLEGHMPTSLSFDSNMISVAPTYWLELTGHVTQLYGKGLEQCRDLVEHL